MVILANGHGSGRAVRQWRSSDVTSLEITGMLHPWAGTICRAQLLLYCVGYVAELVSERRR